MSVAATTLALQALHRDVAGIASAPDEYPGSIETAHLPTVLTWPGAGAWRGTQNTGREQGRTYLVQVFVAAAAQGTLDENVWECIELLQAFGALYTDEANAVLETDDEAATVGIVSALGDIRDTGLRPVKMLYGDKEFFGFEFQVKVEERW